MAFTARLAGRCPSCHGPIEAGDLVRYGWVRHDGEVVEQVVHVDCPDRSSAPRAAEVCTECWLEKPCGCEVS
jgi:hypothetical protein